MSHPSETPLEMLWDAFPAELRQDYMALLEQQAAGGARKAKEVCRRIAETLAQRKVTPRMALKLHLAAIEDCIGGKDPQFAKRVLNCGDVLVLELMSALAEAYRVDAPAPKAPHLRGKAQYVSG